MLRSSGCKYLVSKNDQVASSFASELRMGSNEEGSRYWKEQLHGESVHFPQSRQI
jgi:hypothetical protein